MDYIDKRWPRFYAEYPPILRLMGDVTFKTGDYEKAKGYYWTYYNLDPEEEDIDMVLARLGDIYLQDGHKNAAREVYQEAAARFPDKDGGLVARMRLAEEGVFNEPTVETMFPVFNRPLRHETVPDIRRHRGEPPEQRAGPPGPGETGHVAPVE